MAAAGTARVDAADVAPSAERQQDRPSGRHARRCEPADVTTTGTSARSGGGSVVGGSVVGGSVGGGAVVGGRWSVGTVVGSSVVDGIVVGVDRRRHVGRRRAIVVVVALTGGVVALFSR